MSGLILYQLLRLHLPEIFSLFFLAMLLANLSARLILYGLHLSIPWLLFQINTLKRRSTHAHTIHPR